MGKTRTDAVGPAGDPEAVRDTRGRPLRDLRISVTDRCNFRCVYCMPRALFGADHEFLPRSDLLTFEEIARLASSAASLGVDKVRLTGGEPLVRRDLHKLVEMLAAIPGIRDIALTTNASLLRAQAAALAAAGLRRVTVSLDALDDVTFKKMNDVNFPVDKVLDGIAAAAEAGLAPIKINTVVKRGVNEHAILDLAGHFRHTGHTIRFIEFMDVGHTNGWRLEDVVPAQEIVARIAAKWPLEPVAPERYGEVATRFRYLDGGGEVGIISSVSQPFCGACTRARLSAEGKLYTCLFAVKGHDLRALLREGQASDEELRAFLERVWLHRTDRYSEIRSERTQDLPKIEMSYIGG